MHLTSQSEAFVALVYDNIELIVKDHGYLLLTAIGDDPSSSRVEKNPWKKTFFFVFSKRNKILFLFWGKRKKKHSELLLFHHAISPSSELHNSNLLYLLWHSKLRVKKCTPSLFSRSVVGHFTPSSNAWQACTQQTEKNHSHTNSAVSCHIYLHALLVQHL